LTWDCLWPPSEPAPLGAYSGTEQMTNAENQASGVAAKPLIRDHLTCDEVMVAGVQNS
jgi:hypothetical protein